MVALRDLRDFLVTNGAEIVHDDTASAGFAASFVTRFAHYEDATPGSISWHRHPAPAAYTGSVLLLQRPSFGAIDPEMHELAPLAVTHSNMRALVAKVAREFSMCPPDRRIATTARVHPTAIVGAHAQNYEWTDDGWMPFPVAGSVRVEGHVEIGPFATIVRGSVGDTVLGMGCRIGQHVNVGHDCRIGDHTLIVAHASLAGWVRVGRRCKIYQGARIKNGVRIGDGAVIGMGAIVLEDVGPGEVWAGNPAHRIGHVR